MPQLLTQNAMMRRDHSFNWTLPAWVAQLPDGRRINACPQAGACAKLCYATQGNYRRFPAVREAHLRNLAMVVDALPAWQARMTAELGGRRYRPTGLPRLPLLPRAHLSAAVADLLDAGAAVIRIHDSGDFLTEAYLHAWYSIAAARPEHLFYAYTKEIALVQASWPARPDNLLICYSLGGRQDHLVDTGTDRHADVFPSETAIAAAGYYSKTPHDLLCVVAPSHRIGIVANPIPAFRRAQGAARFSDLEANTRRRRRTSEEV